MTLTIIPGGVGGEAGNGEGEGGLGGVRGRPRWRMRPTSGVEHPERGQRPVEVPAAGGEPAHAVHDHAGLGEAGHTHGATGAGLDGHGVRHGLAGDEAR